MPVDKFERNGDGTTSVYTGLNKANLTSSILRRDGGDTAIGAIDLSGDIKSSVGSDLIRSLGCNNLSAGEKFALLLGSDTNMSNVFRNQFRITSTHQDKN